MNLEEWCEQNGFKSKEKEKWLKECEKKPKLRKNPPRFTFIRGGWRVLTPSSEYPWNTVQQWNGSHCDYFVDFPLNTPLDRILCFMA